MIDQRLLGHLERVDLRDIWISEATGFTPWLARPENIAVLARRSASTSNWKRRKGQLARSVPISLQGRWHRPMGSY